MALIWHILVSSDLYHNIINETNMFAYNVMYVSWMKKKEPQS
jgi:hypothetical protein